MHWACLVAAALVNFSSASESLSTNYHVEAESYDRRGYGVVTNPQHNVTYVDRENALKVPALPNNYDEEKPKKKMKKSPKRIVQKIIKKNKGKLRKMYVKHMTKQPTSPARVDYERAYGPYGQDEMKWKAETTTQVQKKHRNRNPKTRIGRYHMPFQKLQKQDWNKDKRIKRGLSRELLILKDLDQIQFLSKEKDNDMVLAHVTDHRTVK